MEIAIAVFIGIWFSGFSIWGYLRMRKEYKEIITDAGTDRKTEENKKRS